MTLPILPLTHLRADGCVVILRDAMPTESCEYVVEVARNGEWLTRASRPTYPEARSVYDAECAWVVTP